MHLKNIPSALIFIIATLTGGESQNNFNTPVDSSFRLSTSYLIPMHYNLKLIFFDTYDYNAVPILMPECLNNQYFRGESSMTINILHSTRNISLHYNLHLPFPILIKKDGSTYDPKKITSKANMLDLYFSDILYPGLYNLKMLFFGHTLNNIEEGFSRTSHKDEDVDTSWVIATYTQTGARHLFPCLDNPQIRTTFTISIKHPHNSTALSNMPTHNISIDDDGYKWTLFCTTPPLSTHHIAVAVTNYNNISINKNICLWCKQCSRKDIFKFANKVIENVTSHLASVLFDVIVIPKIDHVVIPNFPQDGTSKWGLIFYREEDLIYDEDLDPIMRKIEVARLIAPKIAYQWFGNVVSPSRWSSFWLHDGLATIFGEEAIVKIFDNSKILDFFIVQNQYESLHLDSYYDMNPPQFNNVFGIVSLYSFPRYIKVPIVLRMLKNAAPNWVFRNGLHRYLYTYTFNSVTIDDFWSMQEEVFKESNYTISKEFRNWILYRHYPVLNWTQESPFQGKLTQHFNRSSYGKWWIPTSLTEFTETFKKIQFWLSEEEPYFRFNHSSEGCVMVDIQQAGYYRVHYEEENWSKIISHSQTHYKSLIETNTNVINYAKMIDDAFHFMIDERKRESSFMFWKLTDFLLIRNDLVSWYPFLKMFEYMSNMIPFYEHPIGNNVKYRLSHLVVYFFDVLKDVQRLPKNDFVQCLREEIIKWSCIFRNEECLAMTKEDLLHYVKDYSNINRIPPGRRNWVYCNGLRTANLFEWSIVRNRWLKYNLDLLPYLACTQNSTIVVEYLPYILWNHTTYATQDIAIVRSYINIFHSMISKHANDYIILTDILLILDKIKPKEISRIIALTDIINHVCSEKHLDKILIYTNQHITDKQQLSKIKRKVRTRLSQIKNQTDYFYFIF